MVERDYARVYWRGKTLGLMLVNRKVRNFFLHAETLNTLLKANGDVRLVKRKEQDPEKISTRNPGDIAGSVTREETGVVIDLFFGEAERRIKIKKSPIQVENFIDRQLFVIPKGEFDAHLQSIHLMLDQEKDFNALWTDSRATIPEFYFDREEVENVGD
jgi:hypothetical protein